VNHLVELHGGTVSARSEGPGKGSTFTVRLPRADAAAAPEEIARLHPDVSREPSGSAGPVDLRGVMVLVIDDQPDACEVIRRMLERREAHVVTAGSADEGARRCHRSRRRGGAGAAEGRPALLSRSRSVDRG